MGLCLRILGLTLLSGEAFNLCTRPWNSPRFRLPVRLL